LNVFHADSGSGLQQMIYTKLKDTQFHFRMNMQNDYRCHLHLV